MGCQIIAEYALRHPGRIERVVLEGPTVDRHARSFWPQLWRQFRNLPNERPGIGLVIARDLLAAGLKRALFTLREVLNDRIEDKLPHLQMPVLVVRGEKDAICPEQWAGEVVRLLPHGALQVIPGGGHTMNWSMPMELVERYSKYRSAYSPPAERASLKYDSRSRSVRPKRSAKNDGEIPMLRAYHAGIWRPRFQRSVIGKLPFSRDLPSRQRVPFV
jgi:alpha-beta hydrolase superfamily lysophospholipase